MRLLQVEQAQELLEALRRFSAEVDSLPTFYADDPATYDGFRVSTCSVITWRDEALFLKDLAAEINTWDTDIHAGPGDHPSHLLLTLPAEGALDQVATLTDTCHLPTASRVNWS